jgi:hypothetical protein
VYGCVFAAQLATGEADGNANFQVRGGCIFSILSVYATFTFVHVEVGNLCEGVARGGTSVDP